MAQASSRNSPVVTKVAPPKSASGSSTQARQAVLSVTLPLMPAAPIRRHAAS
ncbi:hypothetical protein [Streptomyces sp. NPDC001205]